MALTWSRFSRFFKGLLAAHHDTSSTDQSEGDVAGFVDRLGERVAVYDWLPMPFESVTGTTGTVSGYYAQGAAGTTQNAASQPLGNRPVFTAPGRPVLITGVRFILRTAPASAATATSAWQLVLNKRGRGLNTGSTSLAETYSVTTFFGGMTSANARNVGHSLSRSLTEFVRVFQAHASNPVHIPANARTRRLGRADVLTARVSKGSGTANDTGRIFSGGQLQILYREHE